MKKRILSFITVIFLILGVTAVVTACSDEVGEYSVTVLSPAEEPIPDVTVLWKTASSDTAGSAKTGADGKATASLTLGTYTIALEGQGDAYGYTDVKVSSSMRNVTLTLSVKKVNYTVTVKDKTGAPASGVVVTWSNASGFSKNATTDANGLAQNELDYGEYSVTLSSLPEGNVYDGAVTVTASAASASFDLREGVTGKYSVTIKSEGGLLFKDHPVQIYRGNKLAVSGRTNDEGVYTFTAEPDDYTVDTSVPSGYRFEKVTLSASVHEAEMTLYSSIIPTLPPQNKTYVIGDIFHNYTFKTPYQINGEYWESTVSEILETKEVLILNNWGTNCSWCVTEMPYMQEVYEKYGDVIEMVAVSNYPSPSDSDSTIVNHYNTHGYTFPMMRDTNGFSAKFNLTGWPTTVVIDRYGAIARIEAGAVTSVEAWERLILKYIGDEYVQTFTPGDKESESINNEVAKPDVEIPADHYEQVAQTLNDTNLFPPEGATVEWYGETEYEYAWPFVLGTVPDVSPTDKVLYSSNTGKANSISIIYATVTVDAGKVLYFDYYAQTEENGDVLSILWDGKIIKTISGDSGGWKTCHLYADLTGGSHTLSIAYIKDGSINTGKDVVCFRRVGFANLSDIIKSNDMLRSAAYGTPEAGATQFPYYADVALGQDGYYHVDATTLQNPQFAGNDESPLLLVNLLNATQWSPYSINEILYSVDEKTGEYAFDCTLTINGVTRDYRSDFLKYLMAASASDVPYCVPVNQELHDLLVAFMTKLSGDESHPNEWLEACYFYSHYGDGEPVGNPILGLMDETAIPVTVGTFTADMTRIMNPFPTTRYCFTPEKSAVYRIESLIPEEDAETYMAQIWLYDDATSTGKPLVYCGDTRVTRGGVNEHNFVVYRYLTAGHKYYLALAFQMSASGTYDVKITEVGQSATVMIPCSDDVYNMVLDEYGNFTGEITLAGVVDYVKDDEGYYHAKNPDGTTGDYIYLDVKYACTTALGTIPIERLVEKQVPDPVDGDVGLGYKFFDFRYRVSYITAADGTINYNPKTDCTSLGAQYKDYTDIVKGYIASAPTSGEYEGLVKVNQEIVDILKLYIEMRVNMLLDGEVDPVMENEWLRFCWYNRTYDENNY